MARRTDPLWAWARVKGDVNHGVRRGAWYRVVRFTSDNALLAVSKKEVRVPRRDLEASYTRPLQWSIVRRDRKSTRLNSSHMSISYAVFCLKKKPLDRRFAYEQGIIEMAERIGISKSVAETGPLTPDEAARHLVAIDVCVLPFKVNPLGRSS